MRRLSDRERLAFKNTKCPRCGEADRLQLNSVMVTCPVCKKITRLKED